MTVSKMIVFIFTCLWASIGFSWTKDEQPKTVVMVGVHAESRGFVTFSESVDPNCLYQHLYFDVSTDLGKSMLSVLTTAKISGAKVRVGYTPPASRAVCMLELAAIL